MQPLRKAKVIKRMSWTSLARLCLLWVVVDAFLPAASVAAAQVGLTTVVLPVAVTEFIFGLPAHLVVIGLSACCAVGSLSRPREQEKRSVIAVAVLASTVWLFFRFFLIFFIITV